MQLLGQNINISKPLLKSAFLCQQQPTVIFVWLLTVTRHLTPLSQYGSCSLSTSGPATMNSLPLPSQNLRKVLNNIKDWWQT